MHGMMLLLLAVVTVVGAGLESISISGTVRNRNGTPISGAIVTLRGWNMTDTTGADGHYLIGGTQVSGRPAPVSPGNGSATLYKGNILISLLKPVPVRIEVYDISGQEVERIADNSTSAGTFRFDLRSRQSVPGIMIIRLSIGQRVLTFRYFPLLSGAQSVVSSSVAPSSRLLKENRAAVRTGVDTLGISAPWFISKDTLIPSYPAVMNIALDSLARFSFFVTSLEAILKLSGSPDGFGGDLRFGKTGSGAGLMGADSICTCIAEKSMPGSNVKQWRAFLSVVNGPDGGQVDARDRIGDGPWYDRTGRLLAPTLADLLHLRPKNGDPAIRNDLPNEYGIPNRRPDPTRPEEDNHHFITGSDTLGRLYSATATCDDWTSTTSTDKPRCGFSWPRDYKGIDSTAMHWISGWNADGCMPGIHVAFDGESPAGIIGNYGGYGGFYCFALNP